MARSIVAVVLAYLLLTVLVGTLDFALVMLFPESFPTMETIPGPPWLVLELLLGLAFTVLAGFVAGAIAGRAEVKHAMALGIAGLVLSLGSMIYYFGRQPLWFQLAGLILVLPASVLGGYLRQRARPLRSAAH